MSSQNQQTFWAMKNRWGELHHVLRTRRQVMDAVMGGMIPGAFNPSDRGKIWQQLKRKYDISIVRVFVIQRWTK